MVVAGGMAGAVVIAVGAVLARGAANYTEAGFSYPGRVTDALAAGLRVVADVSGAVTVGALVFATLCAVPTAAGRIDVDAYAAVTIARRAAPVWAVSSLLLTPVVAADVVGQPVTALLGDGEIWSVIGQTLPSRGWLVTGLLALPVVLGTRWVLSWTGVAGLALWAGVCLLPPVVVGNPGEGLGHDVDTTAAIVHVAAAAVWTGAVVAALAQLRRGRADNDAMVRRFGWLVLGCGCALLVSGAALSANLVGPGAWLSTQYGLLAAAKVVALAALLATAVWLTRRLVPWLAAGRHRRAGLMLACQAAVLLAGFGASVGMAQQPAAAFLSTNPTPSEQQIGYSLTSAPTVATVLGTWRFDLLLGSASIVMAVLYVVGVMRVGRRGARWPAGRTVSFLTGCLALLLLSSSGFAAYAEASFSWHMIVHMGLDMVVPVLLVLGGPLSLIGACRPPTPPGAPPGPRECIGWLIDSWPVRVLVHPFGSVAVFAALLFGLYLTPVFGYAVGYHWGHEAMSIAFLVSGFFLFWQIIGVDPLPHRLPHLGRLGLLIALMPIHALFGVAVLTRQTVLGLLFYGYLDLPWLTCQLADQRRGALVVWIGGEVPLVVVAVLLMIQWWRVGGDLGGVEQLDPVRALHEEFRSRRASADDG